VVVVTVSVDPVMRIGICAVLPLAVATIVAVRVVAFDPDEKLTTALPVESLTALDAVSRPLSTEKVTVTPETAAFDASTTVAVTVAVPLLSEATVVVDADRLIAAAVATGVTGVTGVDDELEPPPPQAASNEVSARAPMSGKARDQMNFNLYSCDGGGGRAILFFSSPDVRFELNSKSVSN
jgi:hypothetical protein